MNENAINIETRKFLKEIGVTSQQQIERAVREAIKSGKLKGNETLRAHMTLTVDRINLHHEIDGEIKIT
jgi:ribosomal protein L1